MTLTKMRFASVLLLLSVTSYGQLGFCTGSKGAPIFTENFGNGTTYGPALPTGTTSYPFVTAAPNDGQYTLFHNSDLYTTWHNSLDHTPDATDGANGKMLLVNANAVTSGDFYKKTVSDLCINTTFEFSAWLLNVYNPATNYCGAGEIPINVKFEIWNEDETVLLGSGNTGNIMGTSTPLWQQFALVFTTANETAVVLKMKNNGVGGCGNDLAIDDISFSSCGDLTTVSSPSAVGDTYISCNPSSLELDASTLGSSTYFYQWQTSIDQISWTNIDGANNATYVTPNLNSVTYFRVKAAQDDDNVSNDFCSALSNVFTLAVFPAPNPGISNGDKIICSSETIPPLSVTSQIGTSINWYDAAAGGTLLQSDNASYTPTAAGIYYAETYNTTTNCVGSPRTPVSLTVIPLPDAVINGNTSICSGNTAIVSFTGTPNAILTYAINGSASQTVALDAMGVASITTPSLVSNSTYTLLSCTSPDLNTCSRIINDSVTIMVDPAPAVSISGSPAVCSGTSSVINFNGTPNAMVMYSVNGVPGESVTLDSSGFAAINTGILTVNTTYQLISITPVPTGCSQLLTNSLVISINPTPDVIYSGSLDYCEGESIVIALSSGITGTTFNWSVNQDGTNGATSGNGNQIAQTVTLENSSGGIVIYTVTPIYNGCPGDPVDINVTIHPLPVPAITDGVICPAGSGPASGQFYMLDTNLNSADHSFKWYFEGNLILNASGNIYNANQTGTYTVIATNSAGCTSAPVDAIVSEMPQGESLAVQQSDTFSDDPTVTITVLGGGGPFSYQLDEDTFFQTSNIFHHVSAGTHVITVVDAYCTNLTTTVTIIDYPKYFTPNADGIHDTWNITGIDNATITIFDRYGKLLNSISSMGTGWDGTYNGRQLPSSDYWFTINYVENGDNKTFRSHFSLKR